MFTFEQWSEPEVWNRLIVSLPGAHLLQTWQWGQVKAHFGWQPFYLVWRDEREDIRAAALVLERSQRLPGLGRPSPFPSREGPGVGLRLWYIPRGPLLDWSDAPLRRQVLSDLAVEARRRKAIFVKIDPQVALGTGAPGEADAHEEAVGAAVIRDLQASHWRFSPEQVQFRNTMIIDLCPQPEALLANMKQKTRYNLRLAERKGVQIRTGELADLPLLFRMYAETSQRDGFVIRDESYYQDLWSTFISAGMAEPLIAEVGGEAAAAVVIFYFAGQAWYLNGMSRPLHREFMPNYLLQWEAIRRARVRGCTRYDLWGAPDVFDESDAMWGVYRFKEGLGGKVERGLGAWDLPTRPLFYHLYTQILPRILDVMRRRGQERTRRLVG